MQFMFVLLARASIVVSALTSPSSGKRPPASVIIFRVPCAVNRERAAVIRNRDACCLTWKLVGVGLSFACCKTAPLRWTRFTLISFFAWSWVSGSGTEEGGDYSGLFC